MLILVLFALAVWSPASGDKLCPPDHTLNPCFCYVENNIPTLYCDRLKDLKSVENVMQAMKGKNISLSFTNSKLGDIPSDFFRGYNPPAISFEECEITSFGERPFSGMEDTLLSLQIYDCIHESHWTAGIIPISHLKKLFHFAFEENIFTKISNEWFAQGPLSLRQVNLEVNDIETLGDKVFAPLINLEQIYIGDNLITQLSRSMFPNPAPKLSVLEMGLMSLESLPEDLFQGMPALKTINLTGNKLKTLTQKTWQPVWGQLDELYIGFNREFVCDKNIRWIYERKLPRVLVGNCYGNNILTGKTLEKLTLADIDRVE